MAVPQHPSDLNEVLTIVVVMIYAGWLWACLRTRKDKGD